jgi:hypothetical protein
MSPPEHSKHLLIEIPNQNRWTRLIKQSACKELITKHQMSDKFDFLRIYSNAPNGLLKVKAAGSLTSISPAAPILPPKAEKGEDTTKHTTDSGCNDAYRSDHGKIKHHFTATGVFRLKIFLGKGGGS